MCCLGQCLSQIGVGGLLNKGTPVFADQIESPFLQNGENTQLSGFAVQINDDEYISATEKESRLIELFKSHGLELSFFGEYKKPDQTDAPIK
jgi:hypothetical protein